MKHQAADALLLLKTTGTSQMRIEDEVPVPRITASNPPKKGEAQVMYMQDYDVFENKEGIGTPEVHFISRLRARKQYQRPITAQEFIQ